LTVGAKEQWPVYAEPPAPFELVPGQALTDLNIPLKPAQEVRGQVIDKKSGAGVAGVQVMIGRISDRRQLTIDTLVTTDGQGWYRGYVRPGRVVAQVSGRLPEGYVAPPREQNL